jgi:nucleoside-diphosphate-sugar epimerase
VYLSTSGVYGDCGGARIDEIHPAIPQSGRGKRRLDAEQQLLRFGGAHGCAVSILRVPGIYARNRLPLDRLRQGLPVLLAGEDVYTNHIHADDLATICVAALARGGSNRVYHASDDSEIRMGDWYDLIADAFALPRAPRVSRVEAAQLLGEATLSFMRESRRLDNGRLKRELGVHLRYPTVREGLAAAVLS